MTTHSIDSLCNAALYYLVQTPDRYDPLMTNHFNRVIYLINVIYYIKTGQSLLNQRGLDTFIETDYGPASYVINAITFNYEDIISIYRTQQHAFDINREFNQQERNFIKKYSTKLYNTNSLDLIDAFTSMPGFDKSNYHDTWNFNQSVNYFKKRSDLLWLFLKSDLTLVKIEKNRPSQYMIVEYDPKSKHALAQKYKKWATNKTDDSSMMLIKFLCSK